MAILHKVTLRPEGRIVEIEEGKNLLTALREVDVYIKSSCGGHATCADCIIKVVSGEDYLTPPPFEELKLLGNVFHITKERLACQTCITGAVTIDIGKHDKASDEVQLKKKTSNFSKKKVKTLVRKEPEIVKRKAEKLAEYAQEEADQKEKSENWKKHWERDKIDGVSKKLAGGKRPKYFDTDKVDYENETYTRPLSPEKQKSKEESLSDKEFKKFRN